jgi:hypothetical protein
VTSPDLQQLLRRLHDELGRAESLDDESRKLLGVVARDITALSAAKEGVSGHVPALERVAVKFESKHPALSAVARQLVDALAKAGI